MRRSGEELVGGALQQVEAADPLGAGAEHAAGHHGDRADDAGGSRCRAPVAQPRVGQVVQDSPTSVTPSTESTMASPGNRAVHQMPLVTSESDLLRS